MDIPKISVILAVYNRTQFLAEAIESILNQTFADFELVVVDDGSDNGTPSAIARGYAAKDSRVRVIRQENTGLAGARNAGIAAARGEYIATMDDDDVSEPTRLEKQAAFLDLHGEVASVNCGLLLIDETGNLMDMVANAKPQKTPENVLIQQAGVSLENFDYRMNGSQPMIRRNALEAVGGYNQWFRYLEDLDISFRLSEKYAMAHISEQLFRYRIHNMGNLLSHSLVWHYLCAAYLSAYYRFCNKTEPVSDGVDVRDLLVRFGELPEPLVVRCLKLARGHCKKLLRTERYGELTGFLSDVNVAFGAQYSDKIKTIYRRLSLWAVWHRRWGWLFYR